jgi:hypothetical protein
MNVDNESLNNSISQINSLIEKSTDSLLCNTECQNERTANDLKNQYEQAKLNYKNGKKQILDTEKNYYVFVNGENEYNEYIDNKLSDEADKLINKYKNEMNDYETNNQNLLDEIQLINENGENTYDLYNEYIKDNKFIKNKYNTYKSIVFTNFRKSYYQTNEYEKILNKYNYYFIFYYFFSCIYIFLLFVYGFKKYSLKTIILIVIFVLIYPICIYYFVKLFLFLYFYCKNLLIKYTPNTDITNIPLTKSRNVMYNNTL